MQQSGSVVLVGAAGAFDRPTRLVPTRPAPRRNWSGPRGAGSDA
jgi:hypothetical protein